MRSPVATVVTAIATDPEGTAVTAEAAYPGTVRRLQAKLAELDPDQLAAVERIVDCILDPEAPR